MKSGSGMVTFGVVVRGLGDVWLSVGNVTDSQVYVQYGDMWYREELVLVM